MKVRLWITTVGLSLLIVILGCGPISFLFKEQTLGPNLALDAKCDYPEAVDGNLNTTASPKIGVHVTTFVDDAGFVIGDQMEAKHKYADITIKLPEAERIHQVVIYSKELRNFQFLAAKGERKPWKIIKEVRGNTSPKIVMRTMFLADRVKLRANTISEPTGRGIWRNRIPNIRGPRIQEIELYGLSSDGK